MEKIRKILAWFGTMIQRMGEAGPIHQGMVECAIAELEDKKKKRIEKERREKAERIHTEFWLRVGEMMDKDFK